jgi:hypothetical protein
MSRGSQDIPTTQKNKQRNVLDSTWPICNLTACLIGTIHIHNISKLTWGPSTPCGPVSPLRPRSPDGPGGPFGPGGP